uniref:ATP synthase subunit a n=1 Tax=Melosira undulata TaxID=2133757 RepID=A0A3G1PWF3_9STRA|nr:ATPase subunit 6 [Melosira undulata]AVR57572.1 ATPase subunit 6 [Melosira undulata]
MLLTPLEQFQTLSIFSFKLFFFDFSITNVIIIGLITFILFYLLLKFSQKKFSFFFIPHQWQFLLELNYDIIYSLLYDNLNKKGEKFFPFIALIFLFITLINLVGLVPYSFTITSHLVITLSISFSIFIGINIICFTLYKWQMFSLFLPSNTSIGLGLLLVPIDFISYFFKPISLGVRLFANLMAGHTLLKVIVGFAWSLLFLENLISFLHLIPLFLIILLFGLELGVALIQAYVFIILTCIYLNDSVNLH